MVFSRFVLLEVHNTKSSGLYIVKDPEAGLVVDKHDRASYVFTGEAVQLEVIPFEEAKNFDMENVQTLFRDLHDGTELRYNREAVLREHTYK